MPSSTPSLKGYLPSDLPKYDRLWLETIYTENLNNQKLTIAQVRSRLRDQLPRNYDPQEIDRRLIHSNHEEITPMGIIVITGSEELLKKGDRVMDVLYEIVLDQPDLERVATIDIAHRAGIAQNEVGLLCHFLYYYGKPFQSYGTQTPHYFGAEYVVFDRYNKDGVIQFTTMADMLIAYLERVEKSLLEADGTDEKPSTRLQVLIIHYLLKASGIETTEFKKETAELIQFLTGKETGAKRIYDTSIYKKAGQPFKLSDKSVIKDLQIIRPYFVNLGLAKAVELIDHEIEHSQGQGKKKANS